MYYATLSLLLYIMIGIAISRLIYMGLPHYARVDFRYESIYLRAIFVAIISSIWFVLLFEQTFRVDMKNGVAAYKRILL